MRTATAFAAHLRGFARRRVNVALLAVLPPAVVVTYGRAMGSFPQLPGVAADPATAGRIAGALFATAFLAGVVGLFQVVGARAGDDRLVRAGFPRGRLVASRTATVLVVAAAAAAVSLATVAVTGHVAALLPAYVGLLLAAGTYGLLGVLIGSLLPRELEGSLALLFVADADEVVSSGLLGDPAAAVLFPLYRPHEVFGTAVREGTFAAGDALAALGYAAVLAALVAVVTRLAGGDGE